MNVDDGDENEGTNEDNDNDDDDGGVFIDRYVYFPDKGGMNCVCMYVHRYIDSVGTIMCGYV